MAKDYKLDKNEYFETLWYIRRYPELKKTYEDISLKSPVSDGSPRGSGTSDPTAKAASVRFYLSKQIKPVEKGLAKVPEEYRTAVMENIIDRKAWPDFADVTTWKRWKRRFIYFVAMYRRSEMEIN